MDFEDVHSSTSSSSLSTTAPSMIKASNDHKKRAGREKMRHPFYRGVRRRKSGKWVSEMREPNKKSRIWLGTFPCPEMAAVAHDVAALALHGDMAVLNFPDSAHRLPRPASSSHQDLQRAARQAAMDFTPVSSSSTSLTFSENASKKCIVKSLSTCLDSQNNVLADPSSGSNSFHAKDDQTKINVGTPCSSRVEFVDEEAVFNMPLLLDSMAEGMLLTPPAMRKGFNWSHEVDDDMDLTLWED